MTLWYKNHWEANCIISGEINITDLTTQQTWKIGSGDLYQVGPNDRHHFEVVEKEHHLSIFSPSLTGNETHDAEGSYSPTGPVPETDQRMFLRRIDEMRDTGKEMVTENGQVRVVRALTKSDGLGFSFSEVSLTAWASTALCYKHHWHRQAYSVLPAFLAAMQIKLQKNMNNPPWLFGHSDGGSIALLYAAAHPDRVSGLIVMSPHIMVEDLSVERIELACRSYLGTDLKQRLGRYHDDPDSAFWGWNDIWLKPAFRDWSIENEIAAISCPLLAVQGLDDGYGTLEQIHGIARRVAQAGIVELANCGHSLHRDQPQQLIAMTARFLNDAMADADADQASFCAQY